MTTQQIIKYLDDRISYINQHCIIEKTEDWTGYIHNTLMEGRLDELRDLKAMFAEERA